NIFICTKFPNLLGIINIQFLMDAVIKLCCISAGSQVKEEINFNFMMADPIEKIFPFDAIANILFFKVWQLFPYGKIINNNNIIKPFAIKISNQAAANKTGSTCNYYYCISIQNILFKLFVMLHLLLLLLDSFLWMYHNFLSSGLCFPMILHPPGFFHW